MRDQARQRKKRNVEEFAFRNRQSQPFFTLYSRQFTGSQRSCQFSQPFTSSSSTNQHGSTTNREFTRGPCRYCVLQGNGGRSARSVSQGSTSAVHLVSCQSVPQTPLTVSENSFMASLTQEASGALGVQYSASHSGPKMRDVNARLKEEFADLLRTQAKYCFD